jgi:RimJ/RimL family protein N-acetyltransferase
MNLELTKNKELIFSIITDPKLWSIEYGQGMKIEDYKIDESFDYLLIKEEEKILGLFQTREITRILLDAHIYLLPEFWGKDYSLNALNTLIRHFQHSKYHQLITDVPEVCSHVINLMGKIGAKVCGYIENGVIYNNKLMGLFLFSYDLKEKLA